ncbi:MAG: hypothetical protein JSU87_09415 [Gemmatimonadota bacterium]|nr:MAG: hypothetical protein JSU87_09415 [Gemmatimonadota bacterium]
MTKGGAAWIALALLFAVASALLGWWTVPIVAALWGWASTGRPWLSAALAAAAAWAALLLVTAFQGPVGPLAAKLGGVMGLPAVVLLMLTVILPATLAGSAAEVAAIVRRNVFRGARAGQGS